MILAGVAVLTVLLTWLAIRSFRSDATVPIAATAQTSNGGPHPSASTPLADRPQSPPVDRGEPQPEAQQQPDAPPSAINEVMPTASQSALNTIRGTIRVSVRVNIDKQGSVVGATAVDRGPSRYFERLAVTASKQWTFTPARSEEKRAMLVKFNFTRSGVTANAEPAL